MSLDLKVRRLHEVAQAKTGQPSMRILRSFAGLIAPLALTWGCAGIITSQNVQPPPQTYSISGSITPSAGGSGATVSLSGAATAATTADSSGNFTFTGLANGTYTVTPNRAGYTFSPSSLGVTVNGANITTGLSFTATASTFSISGTITPAAGGSGATVSLSGAATATTTADSSGNFTFTGVSNGGYVVTPSRTGYTFTPTSGSATVNGANVTGVNFTATQQNNPTFSISGTISPTAGGSGATVSLSGTASATTTANGSGTYTFTGLANGTYTVTPSNAGYTFAPVNQSVTISGANVGGVNFTATVAQAHTVTLSWTASTSTVSGYNVFRGSVRGGPYTLINPSLVTVLSFTDSAVLSGQTYYYVTTAVDASGNQSVYSNEAQAIIP